MAKSFLVIGLGRFGQSVALALTKAGHEVMAVDRMMENVEAIKDHVLHAAQCDTCEERVVAGLGVDEFDAVIICIGTDVRASVLSAVLCLEYGAKQVVAKAQDELHEKLLKKVGAHRVLQPEKEAGTRLAHSLVFDNVKEYLQLSDEVSISELQVPKAWVEKTLIELDVRRVFHVSVIAVRRNGQMISNLDASMHFEKDDTLVLIGKNRALNRLIRM